MAAIMTRFFRKYGTGVPTFLVYLLVALFVLLRSAGLW